jgi:hypothetical protein
MNVFLRKQVNACVCVGDLKLEEEASRSSRAARIPRPLHTTHHVDVFGGILFPLLPLSLLSCFFFFFKSWGWIRENLQHQWTDACERHLYLFWNLFGSIDNLHKVVLFEFEPASELPEWKVLAIEFDYMADFSSWRVRHLVATVVWLGP